MNLGKPCSITCRIGHCGGAFAVPRTIRAHQDQLLAVFSAQPERSASDALIGPPLIETPNSSHALGRRAHSAGREREKWSASDSETDLPVMATHCRSSIGTPIKFGDGPPVFQHQTVAVLLLLYRRARLPPRKAFAAPTRSEKKLGAQKQSQHHSTIHNGSGAGPKRRPIPVTGDDHHTSYR